MCDGLQKPMKLSNENFCDFRFNARILFGIRGFWQNTRICFHKEQSKEYKSSIFTAESRLKKKCCAWHTYMLITFRI